MYSIEAIKSMLEPLSDAPDTQLDKSMVNKLNALRLTAVTHNDFKVGLHEILDYCVRYALASSLVILHLDFIWKDIGGKSTDNAPWRD